MESRKKRDKARLARFPLRANFHRVRETFWYEAVLWFALQRIWEEKCEDYWWGITGAGNLREMGQKGYKRRERKEWEIGVLEGGKWVGAGVCSVAKMLHAMWLCLFVLVTVF